MLELKELKQIIETCVNHFESQKNKLFYIAEVGGNHEGDFELAKSMCKLAIESGADAVKFQLYMGDTLVNPIIDRDRNKHFKKFELTKHQHIDLAKMTIDAGIYYMASVWDEEMLSWIDPYIKIHKVGSGDLTHYKILKLLAETKKPIILSTGLSDIKEIKEAVNFIASIDEDYITQKKLCLLQCTAVYPTPEDEANLLLINTLKDHFTIPIGYSDHTVGDKALSIAYLLGASVIEKHFTDDRIGKPFRDHKISLTKTEVHNFLSSLEEIDILLGSRVKQMTKNEIAADYRVSLRRGLYAKTDINKGDVFSDDNLIAMRPNKGISASEYFNILGKKAIMNIKALEPIN